MSDPTADPSAFGQLGVGGPVLDVLDEIGYDTPTEIQRMAIPRLFAGGDLIGIAQTGTGKTLAFLLPILTRLEHGGDNPQAVVICPTRELAIQVAGEAEKFGAAVGARTVLAYGGTSSGMQKRALADGCDIVVGTPGRLLDFVTSAWLGLRRLRSLVLDEADRMLDMGFINDVDAILRRTPMSRQTMLFSATFPDEIRKLSDRYMLNPETVRVEGGGRSVKASVDHRIYPVPRGRKLRLIVEVLRRERPKKALVFTATREATSELALELRKHGHEVVSLSSLLSQANRERALGAFRRGEFDILVATDVAARGIDITDIDMVVNFDVPMQAEDYVHRIGRTGRAHRSGRAITLATSDDRRRVADIELLLNAPVPRGNVEGLTDESELSGTPPPRGGRGQRGPRGDSRRGRRPSGGGKRPRSPRGSR